MRLLLSVKNFQTQLLEWFDQHGRKNLPWQINKTPYRVWISEIMLQQTQVATVIPYYLRFMERFPSLETLAKASEEDVLHSWSGLGYYSRARNLHATAKQIQASNLFPETVAALEALPGIGRSTAGAIMAIAFEKRACILDGNVKRVLARLTALDKWPDEKEAFNFLWKLTEKLTPEARIADYTQAMMDLGATVCTRSKPSCEICPFKKNCRAHKLGLEHTLPVSKIKKPLPVKQKTFFIFKYENKIFLHKRSERGVWQGLWSFPEALNKLSKLQIQRHIQQHFSVNTQKINPYHAMRHTFTHFHLDIFPVVITLSAPKIKCSIDINHQWYDLDKPAPIGLPAPIKKILETLGP